jgi:branched-chain amino acid transport system permease protein
MVAQNRDLRRDVIFLGLLALALVAIELLLVSQFYRSIAILAMIHAIAAVGLTLLLGYAGQASLGQGAFMGLGAYTVAFAIQRLGLPVVVALAGATVLPGLIGYLIARPILRLSGHNLALGTLALGAAFFVLAAQWRGVTGGIDPGIVDLPNLALGDISHNRLIFWLAAACLVACSGIALALVGGQFGRALMALKTSEIVAAGMGIDPARTKAIVFALSGSFAGLAGALLALYLRSFNATAFGVGLSIELLMMVIVGSLSTVWGALFGAFVIILLPNLLEGFDHAKHLVYGLAMVGIMMFAPRGLGETLLSGLTRKRSREAGEIGRATAAKLRDTEGSVP